MTQTKLYTKILELLEEYQILPNLSNRKFLSAYLLSLIKVRKVQFCEVGTALNDQVLNKSNEQRIAYFFRKVSVDYEACASFFSSIFPARQKLDIMIDRTTWKFGNHTWNVLMVLAYNRHFSLPLYWEFLENQGGNSDTKIRIAVLEKVVHLLGKERIAMVLGDREFVGHSWFKYLKDHDIDFCFRMPKHHKIYRSDQDFTLVESQAEAHWNNHHKAVYLKDCMVDQVWGTVAILPAEKEDFCYLFGTKKAQNLASYYQRRWKIEDFFEQLKSRGFDLESSQINIAERLSKLIACLSLSYAFCVMTGIFHHLKVQKIKVKNHGRKSNSIFRKGLDIIREVLKNIGNIAEKIDLALRFLRINKQKINKIRC